MMNMFEQVADYHFIAITCRIYKKINTKEEQLN